MLMNPAGLPIPVPAAVAAVAAINGMREAALGSAGPSSSPSLLGRLKPGEAVDVWDIHELGWRKALVIASRTVQITNNGNNKLEFLIRYVGWDSKWDEWIRPESNRLASANSKTAGVSDTGYKGGKNAEEAAVSCIARDWNKARQGSILTDIALVPIPSIRTVSSLSIFSDYLRSKSSKSPIIRSQSASAAFLSASPSALEELHHTMNNDQETKEDPSSSSLPLSTPSRSPNLDPLNHRTTPRHIQEEKNYFPAHKFFLKLRCPELLRAAPVMKSLKPENSSESSSRSGSRRASRSAEEEQADTEQEAQKPVTGLSLLSGQHQPDGPADESEFQTPSTSRTRRHSSQRGNRASPSTRCAPPSGPRQSASSPSLSSPAQPLSGGRDLSLPSPPALEELSDEPRAKRQHSADAHESNMKIQQASGQKDRVKEILPLDADLEDEKSMETSHGTVALIPVHGVANALTLGSLLDYLYTGDINMSNITCIEDVFDLAHAAGEYQIDRLEALTALALNRMITLDNIMLALDLGLQHNNYKSVNGSSAPPVVPVKESSHNPAVVSNLLKVALEYLLTHWELVFSNDTNLRVFHSFPSSVFAKLLLWLPLRHITQAHFAVTYPIVHPPPCNLLATFKQLYDAREPDACDFAIRVGEHTIYCHRAVLAARSDYFKALFRSGMAETKSDAAASSSSRSLFSPSSMATLDIDTTQFNVSSIECLVRYLYTGDSMVDSDAALYLSDCTNYFGLSSNALELACTDLVSQQHCVAVVSAAFREGNMDLFRRACRFIDWPTLAQLMAPKNAVKEEPSDGDQSPGDFRSSGAAPLPSSVAASLSLASASSSPAFAAQQFVTPHLSHIASLDLNEGVQSSSVASPPSGSAPVTPFDVALWQAIVAEKSNPSLPQVSKSHKKSSLKRNRGV